MATISEIMDARMAAVSALRHLIATDSEADDGGPPEFWLAVAAAFYDDVPGLALLAEGLTRAALTAADSPRFCHKLRELADMAIGAHADKCTAKVGA